MQKEEKHNIQKILQRTIEILETKEKKDILELKELSNHTIHDISILQNPDSILLAVLTYAIYKLLDRNSFTNKDYKTLHRLLTDSLKAIKKRKMGLYNRELTKAYHVVQKIDKRVGIFIQEVVTKAKINKGAKLFHHGISIKQAAQIMGVTQWELLKYIGGHT